MVDRNRAGVDLPWGWWLRANGSKLEDEQGRTFRSVRDAFWNGRMDFPDIHFAPEQHELLLRVLTSIDDPWTGTIERRHDLFDGDMAMWRFYMCWLSSIGLLETADRFGRPVSCLEAPLSTEGRSVMLMLQATREPEWEDLLLPEVVDAVVARGRGSAHEDRDRALRSFEQAIGRRRHLFAREQVGRTHLVTLTGMAAGAGVRMPTFRVSWSTSFTDAEVRDDFFGWLATRVHRWDDWGELAHRRGSDVLTQHLLGLIVASQAPGGEA